MTQFTLIMIVISCILFVIAVLMSYLEEKTRKKYLTLQKDLVQKDYELSVLQKNSEEIGYDLSLEKIAENITSSLKKVITFSTISYALLEESKISVSTFLNEPVSQKYIDIIHKYVVDSIHKTNQGSIMFEIAQTVQGTLDEKGISKPLSYLPIPLVVHNRYCGLLLISSKKEKAYSQTTINSMYRIINQSLRELERVDEIIKTERSKLESLLLSIPSGAIVFEVNDDEFSLSSINASAREFLHLESRPNSKGVINALGAQFDFYNRLHSVVENKKEMVVENYEINDKTFKIFITPVFLYGTGTILGVTINLQDMTLEREIQEVRDTFTNMVVHELRAPLTSMKGASELILAGNLNDADRKKMLSLVHESTISMLDQINELLDAAKIEAGKFVLKKDRADLNEVIKNRINIFIPVAQQKGIQLINKSTTSIPLFDFDEQRVGQIITNLLSNSIKFTHTGGTIMVEAAVQDTFARVMIADNGIGIPKDKQGILFSKYQQTGQTSGRTGGTGLGLYISKNIIESHGGKIWLESEEGKGTAFYFTIPLLNVVSNSTSEQTSLLSMQRVLN